MRRIAQLALVLVAILGVAVGIVSMPRSRSFPMLDVFTNPDGTACILPCLFGVRPGETLYKQALKVLSSHPMTRNFKVDIEHGNLYGLDASVLIYVTATGVVSRIDLVRSAGSRMRWGSLGDVIADLSVPEGTRVNTDFTISYYQDKRLVFYHRHRMTDSIVPDEPLDHVAVYAASSSNQLRTVPWQGFGTARRYVATGKPIRLQVGVSINSFDRCSRGTVCRTE
jgi:hypothetical protein